MTVPKDINSKSLKPVGKWIKFLIIMIMVVAGLAFGLWYFFLSGSNNAIKNNGAILPSNCYSVNGKETCVTPKS